MSLGRQGHETRADDCYSRPSASQAAADAIPILVDDTYHIFHLTTPPNTVHHPPRLRSAWSRLRSRNLVDWTRDAEPVIRPGEASNPDADGAWTGCAVHGPDGNMSIFYTGYNLHQNGKQVILHTKSDDAHGTTFNQANAKPLEIQGQGLSQFEDIDFRDPYVFFNEDEGLYWMLVATRLASGPHWSRGCIALLTSANLDGWIVQPEPLYAPNDMFCPECPELFTLGNGKWYLVYSRFHAPNAGTVYRVADSPRGPFRIPRDGSHGRLDGRRWYAAKSCAKAGDPTKRIYFGWIGDYVDDEGKWLWGGDLGIPREVTADDESCLRVDIPQGYLDRLASMTRQLKIERTLELSSIGTTSTYFPGLDPQAQTMDLVASFRVAKNDAYACGVILQSDSSEKGFKLQLQQSGRGLTTVTLLTDFPPLDDFWADQYNLHLRRPVDGAELVRHDGLDLDLAGDGAELVLLLRGRLVEVFCGGRSVSWRLPVPEGQTRRLGWFVQDGTVCLKDLNIYCKID